MCEYQILVLVTLRVCRVMEDSYQSKLNANACISDETT